MLRDGDININNTSVLFYREEKERRRGYKGFKERDWDGREKGREIEMR